MFFAELFNVLPCAYCITDRYFFLLLAFYSFIAACKPNHVIFRSIGLIALLTISMRGILNGVEHLAFVSEAASNPLAVCNASVEWFLIPVNQWFPSIFSPMGSCDETGPVLLGLNLISATALLWTALFILGALVSLAQLAKYEPNKQD